MLIPSYQLSNSDDQKKEVPNVVVVIKEPSMGVEITEDVNIKNLTTANLQLRNNQAQKSTL